MNRKIHSLFARPTEKANKGYFIDGSERRTKKAERPASYLTADGSKENPEDAAYEEFMKRIKAINAL